jgi:hypothetical protein
LRDILPVGQLSEVTISGKEHDLSQAIAQLQAQGLPESQDIARQLLEKMGVDIKPPEPGENWVASLAQKLGNGSHGGSESLTPARLLDFYPRNELGLVTDIFFGHSNLDYHSLRQMTENWPYDQKQEVYTAYLERVRQGGQDTQRIFRRARYTFEIVQSVGALLDLQMHGLGHEAARQELTPRYGFDVPEIIDAAGLTEDFEACFDISLRAHSELQSALGSPAAQYAVLQGHKVRALLQLDGDEMLRLRGLNTVDTTSDKLKSLIASLEVPVAEVHPLLGGSQ